MRNGRSGAIEKSGPRACGSVERLTFERSSKFMFSVNGLGVVPVVVWGLDDDIGFEEDEVYEEDVDDSDDDDSDDDSDPYEKYEEYDDQ